MDTNQQITELVTVTIAACAARGEAPVAFDPVVNKWRRYDQPHSPVGDLPGVIATLADVIESYGTDEDEATIRAAKHDADTARHALHDATDCLERADDDGAPMSFEDALAYVRRSDAEVTRAEKRLDDLLSGASRNAAPAKRQAEAVRCLSPGKAQHYLFALAQRPLMRRESRLTVEAWLQRLKGAPWNSHVARTDVWEHFVRTAPELALGTRKKDLYAAANLAFGRPRGLHGRQGWRGIALPE